MSSGGFFLTGANAKLVVNGITLAYATDVSYKISVKHKAPRVLGMIEAQEITPLFYEVTGSFTVIRYARNAVDAVLSQPKDASRQGNSIGSWKPTNGNAILDAIGTLGTGGAEGKVHESLVPARIAAGVMFDMEIRQKVNGVDECTIARLSSCRVTDADFSMSKKSAATQRFSFMARYANEDGFAADKSGQGQDLE